MCRMSKLLLSPDYMTRYREITVFSGLSCTDVKHVKNIYDHKRAPPVQPVFVSHMTDTPSAAILDGEPPSLLALNRAE